MRTLNVPGRRAAGAAMIGGLLLGAIVGCSDEDVGPSAVAIDQKATWTPVADSPLDARYSPLSVWDGERYYVLGGYHDDKCSPSGDCAEADPPLPDGASYDPDADEWRSIADAPVGLDGHVVAIGGLIYVHTYPQWRGPKAQFLSYDPSTDTWTQHPNPSQNGWLTATDDSPVLFSDRPRGESAWFDPAANQWNPLPDNPFWRNDSGYPAWTGSEFIVSTHTPSKLGTEAPLVKLVSLDADLQKWTDLGTTEIVGYAQVAVADRVVWPSPWTMNGGGEGTGDWGAIYPEGGIYEPAADAWTDLPKTPGQGGYCCGDGTEKLVSVSGNLLDPVTLRWTQVPPPKGGVRMYATRAGAPDHALMWGGVTQDDPDQDLLDSGFLLHPGSD